MIQQVEAFKNNGFTIINAEDLIHEIEEGRINPKEVEDTMDPDTLR